MAPSSALPLPARVCRAAAGNRPAPLPPDFHLLVLAALREVRHILSTHGLLILGAPNEGCRRWQLAYLRGLESLCTTDHVHFYTHRTLSAQMAEAGRDVFESKGLGFDPPDWHLDDKIRNYNKWVDDLFECLGQAFMPSLASSPYLLANKEGKAHAAY